MEASEQTQTEICAYNTDYKSTIPMHYQR